MSPFAEPLLVLLLGLPQLVPSAPLPATDPSAAPQPEVRTITAEVTEIRANVVDLSGIAQTSQGPTGIDVVLNSNVLFAKDSATIQPAARSRLAEVGQQIKADGPGTLQVVGYTDDLGSAQHGLQLSQQRAQAVQRALAPYLSGTRTTVTGKGEADPVVPNTSEQNRARNRRVELHFTKG